MNFSIIRQACRNLGHLDVSIEEDGTCWSGTEHDRTFIDNALVDAEVERVLAERAAAKQALLDQLGITAEQARLLLS